MFALGMFLPRSLISVLRMLDQFTRVHPDLSTEVLAFLIPRVGGGVRVGGGAHVFVGLLKCRARKTLFLCPLQYLSFTEVTEWTSNSHRERTQRETPGKSTRKQRVYLS